jgi:hypothetical protein
VMTFDPDHKGASSHGFHPIATDYPRKEQTMN